MSTVSGAGEESAIDTWIASWMAQKQRVAAEKAAARAAEVAAATAAGIPVEPDVVVELSDKAKAMMAANAWYRRADEALVEKDRILKAQWSDTVILGDNRTRAVLCGAFGNATDAQKEAYVQLQLVDFDTSVAQYALYREYNALTNHPNSGEGYSEDEIARRRLEIEFRERDYVESYSAARQALSRPGSLQQWQGAVQPEQAAVSALTESKRPQSRAEFLLAELTRLREAMGAGTGANSDPAVQRYALPSSGPTTTAEQLALVLQSIDAAQTEYAEVSEVWKKAAERGEAWAVPRPRTPSVESAGESTSTSTALPASDNTRWAPEIECLTLEAARTVSRAIEKQIKHPAPVEFDFRSGHGDHAINDIKVYALALKDYIRSQEALAASQQKPELQ